MESFHWDEHFTTGLKDVDEQHHYLVDTINQFGDLLSENKIVFNDIEATLKELTDYAQYHFQDEEELMLRVGIDRQHFDYHIKLHQDFLHEVEFMYSGISKENFDSAKNLLGFLTSWLAFHILGCDQNMARQISAIQSGVSPGQAYEKEEKERHATTEPLLVALNTLFQQVSERNKSLIMLNKSLEEKVAERTKELSEANTYLEDISLTDVLTGLPNRRYAMRSLSAIWEKAVEADSPLVCMMIDADHFKAVNDTYGHDAGDVVLIKLAKTLQHLFRNDDIVCRLGGDEFFVICPDTDKDGGMRVAELVREKVSELRVVTGGEPWHGSICIGVASRILNMKSYDELIRLSDKGVYAAKQDGKNCVRASS